MTQPLLSLCMIIRNEQEMLPGLLASVKGLWDELVVADTGSTDGSRELLAQAGAMIVTHPWADDFAAARNTALAAATGRWILCLDADERVTEPLIPQIRSVLADGQAGAATVVMRNALPDGTHHDANLLRLFRNDPAIRFRHRIHEDVLDDVTEFLKDKRLALRNLSGVVQHLGYVREVAADRNKRQRDQELLRRVLTADPGDFYCWFKLLESARFWADRPLWTAVAAEVAPLLTGPLTGEAQARLGRNPWSGELAALISQGLHTNSAMALGWLEQWRDRVYTGGAWHLRRGLLLESLGRVADADAAFAACIADASTCDQHVGARARLGQCRLAAMAENLDRARDLAATAAAMAPTDPEALLAVVNFTRLTDGPGQIATVVAQHRQAHPASGGPLAEALLQAGLASQAYTLLSELVVDEPQLAMGLLTCALAVGHDIDLAVELDQTVADEALRRWIRILWGSRQTKLMTMFAENCGSVIGVFPWLEEFLGAETRRLQAE